jgi:superfamily II DNA/RNA helicase
MYPAQEEAVLSLAEGCNVILNTPTGSGKSLVARLLHFRSLSGAGRSVYTCPVKALVNEKWIELCGAFGAENVGLSTGDASVNRNAPILCCTAEVLSNIALREGDAADVADVIMDEFHYYADSGRGVAWQVPLLALPQARFLLMSATLGDTGFISEALTSLNGRSTINVRSLKRPVPLEYEYSEEPLPVTLERLVCSGRGPVYVVHFTQADAANNAQNFSSINFCSREEKAAIADALIGERFTSPYGAEFKRLLRHGIGLHHAGLLPRYRLAVERLAQRGLLKVICGTDTLGVGINVPIRCVLLTQLCKFSGEKNAILSSRDFHQITGRAGRKGFDDCGWVVAQAPEHAIENLQLQRKFEASGKKFVKRKAPEKNFTAWDRQTFQRLVLSVPEKLVSRFRVDHGMLLNVLSRERGGVQAMRDLIKNCHEGSREKKALMRRSWRLFRALLEQGLVSLVDAGQKDGARVAVNVGLQTDFSMNQALSLYLVDTISLIDPSAIDYAWVVLSLAESILDDPQLILRRQLDKLKAAAAAQMKAEGVPFEKRMEELEAMEHPKPNRDFIYSTFNAFSSRHPWVGAENIKPKSIVREMLEESKSFADYVKSYQLERSEGLLLRHISSVHKVLSQTVPDTVKNSELIEMETYLGALVRQVDSSILERWEEMKGGRFEKGFSDPPQHEAFRSRDKFDIAVENDGLEAKIHAVAMAFIRAFSYGDYGLALGLTASDDCNHEEWTESDLALAHAHYLGDHQCVRLDAEGRNRRHTYFLKDQKDAWRMQQMIVDPEGKNDWVIEFHVNLRRIRECGLPSLSLSGCGPLGELIDVNRWRTQ